MVWTQFTNTNLLKQRSFKVASVLVPCFAHSCIRDKTCPFICRFDIDNFTYNVESNVEAMGLPVPDTIFGSIATVSGSIASIEGALANKASDVPLSAISKAGGRSKQLASITASFYAGAIIGSALMASKRATSCSSYELREAFKSMGLPVWAADEALKHPDSNKLLRKNWVMSFIADKAKLIGIAIACAIFAYLFWHFLGQNAFYVFPSLVALIYLVEWGNKKFNRKS